MGDLKNSLERLRKLLKATGYPHAHTTTEFRVAELLRILHHGLLDFSRHVAAFIQEKGYDLYGKTDARFIDHCFRLMRDEFQYFPSMTATQFLSSHFMERKVQLVGDMLEIVVQKHDACVRQRRQEQAVWTKPREFKSSATHVENHRLPSPSSHQVVEASSIDTRGLLEHLRRESIRNAREQQRARQQAVRDRLQPGNNDTEKQHAQDTAATAPTSSSFNEIRGQKPSHSTTREHTSSSYNQDAESDYTDSAGEETHNHQHNDTTTNHHHSYHQHYDRQSATTTTVHMPPAMSNGTRAHATGACGCGCSDTKAEVQEVLVTLSKQISDLTSAILSRMSSIETRLSRVEQQLGDLPDKAQAKPSTSSISNTPLDSGLRSHHHHRKSQNKKDQEPLEATAAHSYAAKSSWPPDPDMFD